MESHLPLLPVLLPLVAAPLCVLLRSRAIVLSFAIAVCWNAFALAAFLLVKVLAGTGPLVYELGGWAAPYGIEYRVDVLSAFVALFVTGLGAVVLTFAPKSLMREIPVRKHYLFATLYLLAMAGLLGITLTGDLFNVFVFLEISSLSSYALIAMGPDRRALTATFRYLVLGTIGATFILIGTGLMYQMTGTLNMVDTARHIAEIRGLRTVQVAIGFLTVGIGLKMALFPLHAWLPDAYCYAPSTVTSFLAATATKVSVYVLIRWVYTIFNMEGAPRFQIVPLDAVLIPLAVAAMFVASTVAIFQTNVKRLLAFSSVAQVGYMVLGISLANESGVTGGVVHLFNHALTKGGLFLAMGCFAYRLGSVDLDDLAGIGRRMPLTTLLWVVGGLGLIGVPLTAGFVSKWYLVRASLERGLWPLAVLILLSSLLAVAYVWRVVEVAYFRAPPEAAEAREAPLSLLLPTAALIGASVWFGLFTDWSAGVAGQAAQELMRAAP